MLTFKKMLFPVDLSESSIDAAPYVAAIARKFESEIILLHALEVYNGLAYGDASTATLYRAYENEIRQSRTAELETFGFEEFKDLKVTRSVETGEAAHRITQYADEHGIDLIVMPTHGLGRFRRLLLGSVTSKVLHDTGRPVWTMAHAEKLAAGAGQHIRDIVCAVDLCSNSVRAIRAAADIANRYGAQVNLVHAIPCPDLGRGIIEDASFQRFLFDAASQKIAALQAESQTQFDTSIKHGNVASVVRESALLSNAQLVVIGRGRMQEFLGRLRTNVSAIIREAPCPVLSV
ncbi:MAG: universal stress protein [Bryobacteraceae bacterium]